MVRAQKMQYTLTIDKEGYWNKYMPINYIVEDMDKDRLLDSKYLNFERSCTTSITSPLPVNITL